MKKAAVIAAIIAILMMPQVSLSQTIGDLFSAAARSAERSKKRQAEREKSQPFLNVQKESPESVNRLVLALQGREFKCQTEEAGVISLHFNSGHGMILVNREETLATTNASLKDGRYRWYSQRYDMEYTVINSGAVLASNRDGKVYRGPAITANSGREIMHMKCTRIIVNNLFDPLPVQARTAAAATEKPQKEKSAASKLWRSLKESSKNNSSKPENDPYN